MSVIADFQVSGINPSIVGGTGSTSLPKLFPRLLGPSIGVAPTTPTYLSSTSGNANGQLLVPGNGELDGQFFDVLIAGSYSADEVDASPTVQVLLYANTGTVTAP